MTISSPCVSVVLPVYNMAPYIEAAITSILRQTFTDFELLVVDDCSSDDTVARVQTIKDPRLRLLQNPVNLGRAGTDNAALTQVRGEFFAKMDGDDICHPQRLARQVAVLAQRPEINVVGSWMREFGASTYLHQYPTDPDLAQVLTLFTTPTGNPSVMLRTSLLREQGLHYDGSLRQTEDYDFFARYVRQLRIATLPLPLIQYRVPVKSTKLAVLAERAADSDRVRTRLLTDWGLNPTPRELHVHNTIAMLERPLGNIELAEVNAWLRKLLVFNEQQPWFEGAALRRGLGERWFEVCSTHQRPRLGSLRAFRSSPLARHFTAPGAQQVKFWLKAGRYF